MADTQAAVATAKPKVPEIPAESKEVAAQKDAEFRQAMQEKLAALNSDGTLVRNGPDGKPIAKSLVVHKILKGPNKNTRFLAPQISAETFDNDAKWFGIPYLVDLANTYLRKAAQEEWLGAIDEETGLLNLQEFLTEMAEFTKAAMKIADIEDKIDELQEMSRVILENDNPDVEKLRALSASIRDYKAMKEKKSGGKKKPDAQASVVVS